MATDGVLNGNTKSQQNGGQERLGHKCQAIRGPHIAFLETPTLTSDGDADAVGDYHPT